jgi:hypothetical protein
MADRVESGFDLAVVGGTPGGLMTGIAAARRGLETVILERYEHVGGLPANGLGATDIATRGATGGLFQEFVDRIYDHYVREYGADSEQVEACDDGYHFEPSVAEGVFEAMLEEAGVAVRCAHQFDPNPRGVDLAGGTLDRVRVTDRDAETTVEYDADCFADATYEGDLAAAAGVPFRVGRESKAEFGEPYAGKVYKEVGGDLGPSTTNEGDNAIQSYNFRLCLTADEDNRVPIEKPDAYDREEYASLVDDIETNNHTDASDENAPEGIEWILLRTTLPNGKTDMNNHGRSYLSTDLPEENWPWPTSYWAWRDRFAERLREYTLGLLWFAQNDPELPADFREEMSRWGLAADEYGDNDHFPRQVYVREGRRIEGEHFFTAHDARPEEEGGRPPVYASSVTAAHYPIDSHATRKREPGKVHLEGFLSGIYTEPYTVPAGVMVPRAVDGLLTPVPVSGSHLGFSTLRMEPCWMALGQAAGVAAAESLRRGTPVRSVPAAAIQRDLAAAGAVLMYYDDCGPGDGGFPALQFFGPRGFVTGWEARLDDPVAPADAVNWCNWAGVAPVDVDRGSTTRGELLATLFDRVREMPAAEADAIRAPIS